MTTFIMSKPFYRSFTRRKWVFLAVEKLCCQIFHDKKRHETDADSSRRFFSRDSVDAVRLKVGKARTYSRKLEMAGKLDSFKRVLLRAISEPKLWTPDGNGGTFSKKTDTDWASEAVEA